MLSGFLGEEKFFNGVHVSFYTTSHSEVFDKVVILEISAKFTGKRQFWSLLFNRVAGHLRWSFLRKQVFSCEFSDIFDNTYLKRASRRLLQFLIILIIGIVLLLKFFLVLFLCFIYTCFPYEINSLYNAQDRLLKRFSENLL